MFESKSFYSVLAPMFYSFKIFGLVSFKINNECYQKSKINLIWSLCFMSFTSIYSIIILNRKQVLSTSVLTAIPGFISSSLSPLSMFLHILFGCIFTNKILKSFQDINSFDNEINSFLFLNLGKEYQKGKIYLIIGLIITFIYTLLSFFFGMVWPPDFVFEEFVESFFLYVMPMMINAFVDLQLCAIVLCLKQRFRWLNQRIATISKDFETGRDTKKLEKCIDEFKSISPILEKIRVKHHILCMITKDINSSYSVQILFVVLRSFVTLITGLFYCGRFLIFRWSFTTQYLLYNVIQLSLAMTELVALTVVCSCTSAEAHKTGSLIHNTMMFSDEWKRKLKLQISFFSLQLLHQNVKFTACRIFEVNERLLLVIIGAISTYLVLVIQFQIQDYQLILYNNSQLQ